mgnify:FL=1
MTRFTASCQYSSRFDNQVVEDPSREQRFPLPLRLMQFPLIRQGFIPMAKTILPGFLPEKTRPMSSVETVVMKTGSTLPD